MAGIRKVRGVRLQSGIPKKRRVSPGINKASGLLLRGVVLATYVTDSGNHPRIKDLISPPVAVYCDVLTYPSKSGFSMVTLNKVLVSVDRGGLQSDNIWRPKATTQNILGNLDQTLGSNPATMDGDHVLIGFLNDNLDEPIIIRGLPHPSKDNGNALYPVGKRLKLVDGDGDPDLTKHHGTFYGVDNDGNFVVDSTFANDGNVLSAGLEAPPPVGDSSKGNQKHILNEDAKFEIVLQNMASPLTPVEVFRCELTKDAIEVLLGAPLQENCVKIEKSGSDAEMTLGDGAVSAAIAEHLETLYTTVVTGIKAVFDAHPHPTGTGPSGAPSITFPSWEAAIKSRKLTFPDG